MPIVPLDPFDGEGIGITSDPWGVWLHSDGHGYIAVPAFSCTADGEADHGYGPTQAGRPVWAGVSEDWASDALRLRADRRDAGQRRGAGWNGCSDSDQKPGVRWFIWRDW